MSKLSILVVVVASLALASAVRLHGGGDSHGSGSGKKDVTAAFSGPAYDPGAPNFGASSSSRKRSSGSDSYNSAWATSGYSSSSPSSSSSTSYSSGSSSSSSSSGYHWDSVKTAARNEMPPDSEPTESFTLSKSKEDYSPDHVRGRENAQHYETDMFGEAPKPYNVHDLFENGVDLSWKVAQAAHAAKVNPLDGSGVVNDGLSLGTTFGEDPEESGFHAFPDVLGVTNKWNPVPPNFHPRFPTTEGLDASLYDPHVKPIYTPDASHVNPDNLGSEKTGPTPPNAFSMLPGTVSASILGKSHHHADEGKTDPTV